MKYYVPYMRAVYTDFEGIMNFAEKNVKAYINAAVPDGGVISAAFSRRAVFSRRACEFKAHRKKSGFMLCRTVRFFV